MFLFLFSYSHVVYQIELDKDADSTFRGAYGLILGESGNFEEWGFVEFLTFIVFTILITVVLLNTVIAIMGSKYEIILAE